MAPHVEHLKTEIKKRRHRVEVECANSLGLATPWKRAKLRPAGWRPTFLCILPQCRLFSTSADNQIGVAIRGSARDFASHLSAGRRRCFRAVDWRCCEGVAARARNKRPTSERRDDQSRAKKCLFARARIFSPADCRRANCRMRSDCRSDAAPTPPFARNARAASSRGASALCAAAASSDSTVNACR